MISQYDAFFYWLGQLESGDLARPERVRPESQYRKIENPKNRTGHIGKYQMGERILANLGYYAPPRDQTKETNEWRGFWEGWRHLASHEDFLKDAKAQEYIAREEMSFHWGKIHKIGMDDLVGDTIQGVLITESSLLAGCHMFGLDGLSFLLNQPKSQDVSGSNLFRILKLFSGYQTPYGKRYANHAKAAFSDYLRKGKTPQLPSEAQKIPYEEENQYTWRTQGDDKVRPSHAANDGETFDADDPPDTGNPGEDYGCRCWAEWQVSSDYLPYDPPLESVYPELLLLPFLRMPRFIAAFRALLSAPKRDPSWTLGRFKSPRKWASQLEKRNWTPNEISETIKNGDNYPVQNRVNPGNEARQYTNPETGKFVVRDEVTREILQVGGEGFAPNKPLK